MHNRTHQLHGLRHALGQLADLAVGGVGEVVAFEQFRRAQAAFLQRQAPQRAHEGNRLDALHRRIKPAFFGQIADQPLGLLAAALLEPESQDSFLAWGFFPEILAAPSGAEDFVRAPIAEALLAADAQLRAEFEAKLAADAAFAADGDARLDWLSARLPDRSPYHHLYPVLRER